MTEKIADLHIHTYYSDGTMSPEEILNAALSKGVGVLAVTDHDVLDGTLELQRLCQNHDIKYIPGVELDSLDQGNNIHILGYGMDGNNKEFKDFVNRNRVKLDTVNSMLIEKMQNDYDNISVADYSNYSYDRTKGGWKALHYLMDKGLTNSLREGFAFYPRYDCTYKCVDFLSVEEVCGYIHLAGGKAVLAHPGVSIKEEDIAVFEKEVRCYVSYGVDGIECYYPTHTQEITAVCLKICNEQDLLITCGSDCHGTFGFAEVGETNTPIHKLNLKGIR
ncbi:MAG TPA: PHP domain-containing protein [Mobilitalea sp.]|nr:PHP domain-containing protein [Mobilitalea sp.]